MNSFKAMLLPQEPQEEDDEKEKEKEEEEEQEKPSSNIHLIWDDTKMDDIDDDIMEEACVGKDCSLHPKGAPKTNDSPSISNMTMKRLLPQQ